MVVKNTTIYIKDTSAFKCVKITSYLLFRDFVVLSIYPKPQEICNSVQGNGVFNLVACHYNFQCESQNASA